MIESYYTPEQMEYLKKRERAGRRRADPAGAEEWPELIAEVRAEMQKGTRQRLPRFSHWHGAGRD